MVCRCRSATTKRLAAIQTMSRSRGSLYLDLGCGDLAACSARYTRTTSKIAISVRNDDHRRTAAREEKQRMGRAAEVDIRRSVARATSDFNRFRIFRTARRMRGGQKRRSRERR